MNLLAILGTGAALYQIFKPKDQTVDVHPAVVAQAVQIAQQSIGQGVPIGSAINHATESVIAISQNQPPPPPPVKYSSTPVPTAPSGPIVSLSDPRIAEAIANKNAMFGAEISAVGMPLDVRNALVAQGWTWTGSYFNPGGLYPPGTDQSKIIVVA